MRIAIAGAGAVGRAVAAELLGNGHKVLLIEQKPDRYRPHIVPEADWLLADACEVSTLEEAELQNCDTVIAATGDDKANLAISLLAKSEFGAPRVVARINNAANEWLFTDTWGVDVAVSTPRAMVATVEGAIDVGHLVRMLELRQGRSEVAKLTLGATHALVGQRIRDIRLPDETVLAAIVRTGAVIVPPSDHILAVGDEMVFVTHRATDEDR
jgi:trk system potassium uptake protein TrkA